MNVARIYLRVSTDERDLTRQAEIEHSTRSAAYYIAGVYREKASGARADRPEIRRMIADLQPGEVVVAERIDRISRLPLAEAQRLVGSIRSKGARLAVPGLVDLSEFATEADSVARIVLESVQELLLKMRCKWRAMTTRRAASDSVRVCNLARPPVNTRGVYPMPSPISASSRCAAQASRSSAPQIWPGAAKAK